MLVLFETPAGYAVFKVGKFGVANVREKFPQSYLDFQLLDESKLKKLENIWDEFATPSKAQEM